ncbi:MAG: L-threonylcarbamoyladenylate synthase [Rikenellaceae bacterium]
MQEITDKTIEVLRAGGVILYPTDTVWGLGCDATNAKAVERIYEIKRRADSKAMIMLVDSIDSLLRHTSAVPPILVEILEANSGSSKPLTVIIPKGCGVAANALPEEKTIAMRIPEHDFCQKLCRKLRRALISTSANVSGEAAPSRFAEISKEIRDAVDYIVPEHLEKGATGKPSSIISIGEDCEVKIIR